MTETKELTLDDLYRIEKAGINRDVTDKELFGLIALARKALRIREAKVYALALSCTRQEAGVGIYVMAGFTKEATNAAEAIGIGLELAKRVWPISEGHILHGCQTVPVDHQILRYSLSKGEVNMTDTYRLRDLETEVEEEIKWRFEHDKDADNQTLNEIVDGVVPVYHWNLLEYAQDKLWLASAPPENATGEEDTAVQLIAANIAEHLEQHARKIYDQLLEEQKEE